MPGAAELASLGLRRCCCGGVKTIISTAHREQLMASGADVASLDRCLDCEQFAAIRAAGDTRVVLSLNEFEEIIATAGRIHRPALLLEAYLLRTISATTVTATVGPVWEEAEYPEESLGRASWLELFTTAGFTIDGKAAARPAEPITLWRGSVHARRRRMSWTSDRPQAQRFASDGLRGRQGGRVYQTVAPPAALLCINNGRAEAEHVINTRGLTIREA